MKTPSFQFYPKQWLGDDNVMLMSWTARGMHMHFMCIAWQQTPACTLPDNDEMLRGWAANSPDWELVKPHWEQIKAQVLRAWDLQDGRWLQTGLLAEYKKQQENRDSKKRAADARWGGSKDDPTPDLADAHALHMQCSTTAAATALSTSASSSDSTTATSWPKTADRIFANFPAADEEMLERIVETAQTAMPDITDRELFDALAETFIKTQTSPGLWLKTLPGYLRRNASRLRARRQPLDQETRGSPNGPQRIGPSSAEMTGGVYVQSG